MNPSDRQIQSLVLAFSATLVPTMAFAQSPTWTAHSIDPRTPESRGADGVRLSDVNGVSGGKSDLVQLYDLDRDGDLDIMTTFETTNFQVMWYENPFSENNPGSFPPPRR